ncbi:MAG: peptide ABC transporter substrate-binding protein [Negativicutes bacterium]|jgi:oligopeptide transport system substrate-binding protein
MINKTILLLTLVVLGLVMTAAGGCGKKSDDTLLRWAVSNEPGTLDPRKSEGTPEGLILFQLFEGLVTENAKGEIVPAAAETWDVSADGTTYTFHLRDGLKWGNGDPLSAHDFEWTWKSTLDPKTGSNYTETLYFIKGAENYNKGTGTAGQVGVKAIDDRTLVVTLNAALPFWLYIVGTNSKYLPVNSKLAQGNPKWSDDISKYDSNGPFLLTEWKHNSKISFKKNPNYWNKAVVKMEKVDAAIIENKQTALTMFQSGKLDASEAGFPSSEAKKLIASGEYIKYPLLYTYYISFNRAVKPLDDVRVREALALALDRQKICAISQTGAMQPAFAMVSHGCLDTSTGKDFRAENGALFSEDVQRAKKLLAGAGYPDGKGFPKLQYLYHTTETNKQIAEIMQEMWKKNLGIDIEMTNQEFKVYVQTVQKMDYQIARCGWYGDYPDPLTFLNIFVTGNGQNRSRYSNDAYDMLINTAITSTDGAVRFAAMKQAEAMLIKDMPVAPIYFDQTGTLRSPRVKGIIYDPTELVLLREAYFE